MVALVLRLKLFSETQCCSVFLRYLGARNCPNDQMMCHRNNGTERLNEDLKYDELVGYKNCTLNEFLQVLIENFIMRKHYEKYIELNVKLTSGF